jgi:hypothetical protein
MGLSSVAAHTAGARFGIVSLRFQGDSRGGRMNH